MSKKPSTDTQAADIELKNISAPEKPKKKSSWKFFKTIIFLIIMSLCGAVGYVNYLLWQKYDNSIYQITELQDKLEKTNKQVATIPQDKVELPSFKPELQKLENNLQQLQQDVTKLKLVQPQQETNIGIAIEVKHALFSIETFVKNAEYHLNSSQPEIALSLLETAASLSSYVKTDAFDDINKSIQNDIVAATQHIKLLEERTQIKTLLFKLLTDTDNLVVLSATSNNEESQPTTDINDWKKNIKKNISSFDNKLIKISKRNFDVRGKMDAQIEFMLKSNIKLNLHTAIIALITNDNITYEKSINMVNTDTEKYFQQDMAYNTILKQLSLKNIELPSLKLQTYSLVNNTLQHLKDE